MASLVCVRLGKHGNFSDQKTKKDEVAIPYELKLPCKNVRDEMLKIRTFRSYWIPLFLQCALRTCLKSQLVSSSSFPALYQSPGSFLLGSCRSAMFKLLADVPAIACRRSRTTIVDNDYNYCRRSSTFPSELVIRKKTPLDVNPVHEMAVNHMHPC